MNLTLDALSGGLTPEHEFFFPEKPENPDMRESTSMWLFEESGAFGMPRIGIEGEAHSWENRLFHANFALENHRVLHATGRGPIPSPIADDGKARNFGAGPLSFHCIDPFRKWAMIFDGIAVDGSIEQQISSTMDKTKQIPVRLEIECNMATPGWVEDNSPEKVAKMSAAERADAESMGIGWRIEHLFRGLGELTVDGETREFRFTGNRIKRQSVRPLTSFRGHCWQACLFPNGDAFAFNAYPPAPGANDFNQGYVFIDGKMYPARAKSPAFLKRLVPEGDDVSVELISELGTHKITASTVMSTCRVHNMDMAAAGASGFVLQQSGAKYTWNSQTAFGMVERSNFSSKMDM